MSGVVEPPTGVVGVGRRLFQGCIGGDHLPRDQVLADTEMLQRALRLRPPQLVSGHLHHAHTVGFSANFGHSAAPNKTGTLAVSSYEWRNLGGNGNLQHGWFRFGPGLYCSPLDGVEIVKACGIAAVAPCQRDDIDIREIEAGNARAVFEHRKRLEDAVFLVAQDDQQNRQPALRRGPERLNRVLERSVADYHDHRAVTTGLALAERDADGRWEAPTKPPAGAGEEGGWLSNRPTLVKIGEI